ncbi:MAG: LLM class flavin-dependent oxidoreductase [Turicibacter sp.]|nr:LLM class flavin-dependent oxidoreductase [Turicibacter sp.]
MKFGYWTPIFGGWLRNSGNEDMPATFEYAKKTALKAEAHGFDMTLIAELYLNDIKGIDADALEAWSTAAGLAAVTHKLQILAAIRPGYHNPAVLAKAAANIDWMSNGRLALNVVSAWWEEEARQYGGQFTAHDERYARTAEFIQVLKGLWTTTPFSYHGNFYQLNGTHLAPKPLNAHIPIYAGGESEKGKETIANHADSYVMHGGTPAEIKEKIADMANRRKKAGLPPFESFGMAAFVICRDTEEEALAELERITRVDGGAGFAGYKDFTEKSKLEQAVSLQNYSVSNRGLRPGLVGTPTQIKEKIKAYEDVGLNLLILQFSPHLEEMDRFAQQVMAGYR